jgi:uncharacterized protein YeaO (DUF488 family)
MKLQIKRVYEQSDKEDGIRILDGAKDIEHNEAFVLQEFLSS